MRSFFRNVAGAVFVSCLFFGLACEQHHVGELPEQQKERGHGPERGPHADHADPKGVDHNNEMVKQSVPVYSPSAAPPASATPANFFPEQKKP